MPVRRGAGLVVMIGLLMHWAGPDALRPAKGAEPPADLQRTIIEGLQFREGQLRTLHGEAVVDSYYGPAYWPWLREHVQPVRDSPGKERDRDRAVVRFDLSETSYRVEAQSVYWGGASLFFSGDTGRAADDVGDLRVIDGATETGMVYRISYQTGYPMASYFPTGDTTSGFRRGRPAIWLGVSSATYAPLSQSIRAEVERADAVDWQGADLGGVSCWLLTLHQRPPTGRAVRVRYWFAPCHDCAVVRKERIGHDPQTLLGQRYIEEWSDFGAVPPLASALPQRYKEWLFTYNGAQSANATDVIYDIRLTALSIAPPRHDLLGDLALPAGARIIWPVSPECAGRDIAPDYEREMIASGRIWGEAPFWAKEDWKAVAPAFPQEWAQGIDETTLQDLVASQG